MDDDSRLVVVVVSGPEAIERAVFGLASALTAAISGVHVRVLLSMSGVHWAAVGTGCGEAVNDFPSIDELLVELAVCGVPIEACAESLGAFCPRGADDAVRLRPTIAIVDVDRVSLTVGSTPSVLC